MICIELNDFIEAIAGKLRTLWPERKVYDDKIPAEANGSFFVGLIDVEQHKRLDRRRLRSMQFEVLYFLCPGDMLTFRAWAESMLDHFEYLSVSCEGDVRLIRTQNMQASVNSDAHAYQVVFDVDLDFVIAPPQGPAMEHVDHTEVLE